jgi:hypothetical protein
LEKRKSSKEDKMNKEIRVNFDDEESIINFVERNKIKVKK